MVVGGAGFIGSFLCETLLRMGDRVICVDDFSSGHVRNIESFLKNPNFQFLKLNINEPFDLDTFAELEPFKVRFLGVQEIYHLALPNPVKSYETMCMPALLAASVGTKHVMDMAVKYRARVVLGSSATVYGDRGDAKEIDETEVGAFDHLNPRGCFNEGKRFAETMVETYASQHKLDVKIARIFRTYGPRMPLFRGHQIPDFVLAALDGQPIGIMGDAETKTTLVYVTDIVDGLIRMMRGESGLGAVNLGGNAEVPISRVAELIMELSESKVPIRYEEVPAHLIRQGVPSLRKAKEKLGWVPLVRLEDGLRKTVDYVRANKLLLTENT